MYGTNKSLTYAFITINNVYAELASLAIITDIKLSMHDTFL